MKTPLISIIVPIYNVEQYLQRCVDTLLNQTYTNLEIILVDDGSLDSCPQMCDDFAKTDERIRVIHKENGGLSDARNVAIDICKGEYILFVDSDDFIALDTVELLYKSLIKNSCDISTCGYVNHYNVLKPRDEDSDNTELVLNADTALENMLYQRNVTTSAWGKLYDRRLFDGIRYPKGKICEDLPTTYKLFSRSNKIVINSSIKFYYQQRMDSIINSQFALKRMDALGFAKDLLYYVEKKHPSAKSAAQNRYFAEAVFIIVQIPYKDHGFDKARESCAKVIKKYRRSIIFDTRSRKTYRLYALLSYLGCNNMARIYNFKAYLQTYLERKAS